MRDCSTINLLRINHTMSLLRFLTRLCFPSLAASLSSPPLTFPFQSTLHPAGFGFGVVLFSPPGDVGEEEQEGADRSLQESPKTCSMGCWPHFGAVCHCHGQFSIQTQHQSWSSQLIEALSQLWDAQDLKFAAETPVSYLKLHFLALSYNFPPAASVSHLS